MQKLLLNSDLGESFGVYTLTDETQIIPIVDQANIACGFHGGDPSTILASLTLCAEHEVEVGAHPSYPDLQGFGRRSMHMAPNELEASLLYQISALIGLARCTGINVSYVKPHGALYNDMMRDEVVFSTILNALKRLPDKLPLMILGSPEYTKYKTLAQAKGVSLLYEAFADRRYTDRGSLSPRSEPNAVLNENDAIQQAKRFYEGEVSFPIDSLCVHGDSPAAINMVKEIRALINA